MTDHDLTLLRRKTAAALITVGAWSILLLCIALMGLTEPQSTYIGVCSVAYIAAWVFEAYWIALDAAYRGTSRFWWTLFALVAGLLALVFYLLSRPPAPALCTRCGARLARPMQICPACGGQSLMGRAVSAANRVCTSLVESLASVPLEQAKHTVKHMAIALAAVVLFGLIVPSMPFFLRVIWLLCVPTYWVAVAWWVYLDAMWRRMDAMPWAALALLTNAFGLVTYLVVRYPDPRMCPQCGAYLTTGLKRCPYCGSEAEPTCPRCQAAVRPDWAYCPACASQLPSLPAADFAVSAPEPNLTAALSIRGTVADASTGSPIVGAEVRVDSKASSNTTKTDPLGRFVLADLPPRPYVLVASAEGFSCEAKGFTPSADGSPQVHFALYPIERPQPCEEEVTQPPSVS